MQSSSLKGERAIRRLKDPSFKCQERKQLQKLLLTTEGKRIKTGFAETDTIRISVQTIERLKEGASVNESFDGIINKLLDAFYNK
jgi:hypothetical protein